MKGGEIGELHDPETHLIPLALAASSENGPELQVFGSNYPTPDWHLRARLHSC
jgi:UDP-arabinose 4-epimerase